MGFWSGTIKATLTLPLLSVIKLLIDFTVKRQIILFIIGYRFRGELKGLNYNLKKNVPYTVPPILLMKRKNAL